MKSAGMDSWILRNNLVFISPCNGCYINHCFVVKTSNNRRTEIFRRKMISALFSRLPLSTVLRVSARYNVTQFKATSYSLITLAFIFWWWTLASYNKVNLLVQKIEYPSDIIGHICIMMRHSATQSQTDTRARTRNTHWIKTYKNFNSVWLK